jgi:hypothetical protein
MGLTARFQGFEFSLTLCLSFIEKKNVSFDNASQSEHVVKFAALILK